MHIDRYHVLYLGWEVSPSIGCREHTETIVNAILDKPSELLASLSLEITKEQLNITQTNTHNGKRDDIQYPTIRCKDISYVMQSRSPDDDVIACVFLGYNSSTGRMAHVHVYRCSDAELASKMMVTFSSIVSRLEHRRRLASFERDLVRDARLVQRPDHHVTVAASPGEQHIEQPPWFDLARATSTGDKFASPCDEFNRLLRDKNSAPILLPARDYDAPVRSNTAWRCRNNDLVGGNRTPPVTTEPGMTVIKIAADGSMDVVQRADTAPTPALAHTPTPALAHTSAPALVHTPTPAHRRGDSFSRDLTDGVRRGAEPTSGGIKYAGTGDDVPIDYVMSRRRSVRPR